MPLFHIPVKFTGRKKRGGPLQSTTINFAREAENELQACQILLEDCKPFLGKSDWIIPFKAKSIEVQTDQAIPINRRPLAGGIIRHKEAR